MRSIRNDRGQELVEFALIAPLLFLLLFGIMEFGLAVWHYNSVAVAAREGARAAVVAGPSTGARVTAAQDAATDYAQRVGLIGVTAAAEMSTFTVGEGEYAASLPTISVTVTYPHHWVTQILGSAPITLEARSSMIVE